MSKYIRRKLNLYFPEEWNIFIKTLHNQWADDTRWKKGDDTDGSLIVEGRWAWMYGASLNNDERIMELWIYPLSGEKEIVAYDRQSVYKCYFLIDELIKK